MELIQELWLIYHGFTDAQPPRSELKQRVRLRWKDAMCRAVKTLLNPLSFFSVIFGISSLWSNSVGKISLSINFNAHLSCTDERLFHWIFISSFVSCTRSFQLNRCSKGFAADATVEISRGTRLNPAKFKGAASRLKGLKSLASFFWNSLSVSRVNLLCP